MIQHQLQLLFASIHVRQAHLPRERVSLRVDLSLGEPAFRLQLFQARFRRDAPTTDFGQLFACRLDFELSRLELSGERVAPFRIVMNRLADGLDATADLFELGLFGFGPNTRSVRWRVRTEGKDEEADPKDLGYKALARGELDRHCANHSDRLRAWAASRGSCVILPALFRQPPGAPHRQVRRSEPMNRFVEFSTNHPFLVAAAAILTVLVIVFEFRQRARGSFAIAPNDAVRLVNAGALVVDVRDAKAYEAGHIIDARSIPAGEVAQKAESLKKFKEKPVVVYCDSGTSSSAAAKALMAAGFTKVVSLRGGLQSWLQENLPVVKGAPKK